MNSSVLRKLLDYLIGAKWLRLLVGGGMMCVVTGQLTGNVMLL